MTSTTLVEVFCPHCRKRNVVEVGQPFDAMKIVDCDVDGGCGRTFVADVVVSITATGRRIAPASKRRASS